MFMADGPGESPLSVSGEGVLDKRVVKRRLDDLKDAASGAGTLQSAFGIFDALSEPFEFQNSMVPVAAS